MQSAQTRRHHSRIARQIAAIVDVRGDAPVIVVPASDDHDMAAVVRTMAEAMGYDTVSMRTRGFAPGSAYFSKPEASSLLPKNRGRLYVLDDRHPYAVGTTEDPETAAAAQDHLSAVMRHIGAAGGIRLPIVVVSRHGDDLVTRQATMLRDTDGFAHASIHVVLHRS